MYVQKDELVPNVQKLHTLARRLNPFLNLKVGMQGVQTNVFRWHPVFVLEKIPPRDFLSLSLSLFAFDVTRRFWIASLLEPAFASKNRRALHKT